MQGLGSGASGSGFQATRLRVAGSRGLGFGVWGLGFGV